MGREREAELETDCGDGQDRCSIDWEGTGIYIMIGSNY